MGLYTCIDCGAVFDNRFKYSSHRSTHFTKGRKFPERNAKKKIITKICICGKSFDQEVSEKAKKAYIRETCSKTCTNKLIHLRDNKSKVKKIICKNCGISFEIGKRGSSKNCPACNKLNIFKKLKCALHCRNCRKELPYPNESGLCKFCWQEYQKTDKYKKKIRLKLVAAAKKKVKEGTHVGWKTRNIMSYPEKFFQKVLDNNGLKGEYVINKPIPKKNLGLKGACCYFLDFYFDKFKLDLEVDGSQHEFPERKLSDKNRDEALTKNGYKVYRIKWREIRSKAGKEYIKEEINRFLNFLPR